MFFKFSRDRRGSFEIFPNHLSVSHYLSLAAVALIAGTAACWATGGPSVI